MLGHACTVACTHIVLLDEKSSNYELGSSPCCNNVARLIVSRPHTVLYSANSDALLPQRLDWTGLRRPQSALYSAGIDTASFWFGMELRSYSTVSMSVYELLWNDNILGCHSSCKSQTRQAQSSTSLIPSYAPRKSFNAYVVIQPPSEKFQSINQRINREASGNMKTAILLTLLAASDAFAPAFQPRTSFGLDTIRGKKRKTVIMV